MIDFKNGDIICSENGCQLIINNGCIEINDKPLTKEELNKRNMIIITDKNNFHSYWYQK